MAEKAIRGRWSPHGRRNAAGGFASSYSGSPFAILRAHYTEWPGLWLSVGSKLSRRPVATVAVMSKPMPAMSPMPPAWSAGCSLVISLPVDLIIANAGMGGTPVLVENAGETDAARRIISVNTLGVINTVTPLLPRLIGRRAGQIAIVSSLSAFVGIPVAPAYSASKAQPASMGMHFAGYWRRTAFASRPYTRASLIRR